jgi:uncharacterized protein YoaH (UPF0181 family)
MKTSTRKKLVEAMQRRLEEILGAGPRPESLPAADRQMYKEVSEGLKGKVDDAVLLRVFRSAAMRTIWARLESELKDKPEPPPEQLKRALAEIEAVDIGSMTRATIKVISRKLRPAPPGKSPRLDPQEQQEALVKVEALVKRGMSRKKAYAVTASEYDLHWRTIQELSRRVHKLKKGEV